MAKTKKELESELALQETLKAERKISDNSYADKIVEKIVFGGITFILIGVLGALIALVIH